MALMFQRLARNFAKNGYFPTDGETMSGILSRLCFKADGGSQKFRIIDPCCGEGAALAECKAHLEANTANQTVEAIGIEIDKARAYHAKSMPILDTVVHSNINNCYIAARQFGLLLLNPPYGDMLSDQIGLSSCRERYETMFYENTNKLLQFGGVLVFIIPHYSLDEKLSKMIASHFDNVSIYIAPEQKFKQVVIFGVRCRAKNADVIVVEKLQQVARDINSAQSLADNNCDGMYFVPQSAGVLNLTQKEIDTEQLASEIKGKANLWGNFQAHFSCANGKSYRPLNKMSDWHLALALAAGQISGEVKSKDGRTLLVKGNTFKDKKVVTSTSINESTGDVEETVVSTDVFVPVIKAIDLTSDSNTFGDVFDIR